MDVDTCAIETDALEKNISQWEFSCDVEVDYKCEENACIIYSALASSKELQPDKVRRLMSVSNGKLSVRFEAVEARYLCAPFSAFMDGLTSATKTIEEFGKGMELSQPIKSLKTTATPTRPFTPQTWTTAEEVALANAWIDITKESANGNAQIVGRFWNCATNHFHNAMGRDVYRTHNQLSSKWRDLNQKVGKFNKIYNSLSQRTSGLSEADILREALEQYRLERNGSAFIHGSAWDVLKKCEKWVMLHQMDHPTSGQKRTKASDSNECMNEEDEDVELEEPRRPIGKDKGKRVSSSGLSDSNTDERIDRVVELLDRFTASYDQHLELEKEKIRIKEKALEDAREVEDFKILTTKINHLTGPIFRAALALKEKIAKKHGFQ